VAAGVLVPLAIALLGAAALRRAYPAISLGEAARLALQPVFGGGGGGGSGGSGGGSVSGSGGARLSPLRVPAATGGLAPIRIPREAGEERISLLNSARAKAAARA
jgi:hypothetical protein